MIPSNAALPGAFGERLLVLPSEQRRVAARERPLERRSEGQLAQSRASLVHLHPHRAHITATRPTDLLLTGIPVTHSRTMDIKATRRARPPTPVLRAMLASA